MPDPIAASNIAAQAFRAMELAPISSFADTSAQASDAKEQYPVALAAALETCDWSFASFLATLPPAAAPAAGFAADDDLPGLFKLPSDCVKLRQVRPEGARWRLDQTFLRCDQVDAVTIRYTRLITNEAQLPVSFQTAVAYHLAVLMAPRWVSSRTKRADLKKDAEDFQKEAERNDAPMASPQRYDDRAESTSYDWVTEALR